MTPVAQRAGDALAHLGEATLLAARAILAVPRRPLELRAFARELFDQGNRALGLLVLASAFVGLVMAFQFGQSLDRFGARQYIGQLTVVGLSREMIPVLIGLVLGGRIVAGIAAELGAMAVTEQIDAVRAMGADPVKKLVMPRVLATTLVLPVFTILGDVIGAIAGMVVARVEFDVPVLWYLYAVRDFLVLEDFTSGVVKAAVFGAVGAVIACDAGLRAHGGTVGVGRVTTRAVVTSSLAVIVSDYLVTRMFFSAEVIR